MQRLELGRHDCPDHMIQDSSHAGLNFASDSYSLHINQSESDAHCTIQRLFWSKIQFQLKVRKLGLGLGLVLGLELGIPRVYVTAVKKSNFPLVLLVLFIF